MTTPEKLGMKIGIGGYDTIKNSYVWLLDHGYVTPAPDVPTVGGSVEIIDPRDLVVTPQGKKALKPYLATFSLGEVAGIVATTSVLAFVLGMTYNLFQLFPSYLVALIVMDLLAAVAMGVAAATAVKVGRARQRERVSSLMDSVVDRG